MPDLDSDATDIDDPCALLERLAYRNARMLDRTGHEEDPVLFIQELAGQNRADISRLAELLGHDLSDLIA